MQMPLGGGRRCPEPGLQVELVGWQKEGRRSPLVRAGAGDMVRVAARIPGPSLVAISGLTTTKQPRLITGAWINGRGVGPSTAPSAGCSCRADRSPALAAEATYTAPIARAAGIILVVVSAKVTMTTSFALRRVHRTCDATEA